MSQAGGILMIQLEPHEKESIEQNWANTVLSKRIPTLEDKDLITQILTHSKFNVYPPTNVNNIIEYMAMYDGEWDSNVEESIAYLEKHGAHLSGVFKDHEGNTVRSFKNEMKPKSLLDSGEPPVIRTSIIDQM